MTGAKGVKLKETHNLQTQENFNNFLNVSKNQAEFDRRVQKAIKTAKEKELQKKIKIIEKAINYWLK